MDYLLIPSKSKSETNFLLSLMKKMQKEVSMLSSEEMEDIAFITALKEAELSEKGSMSKVKTHLSKIVAGK